MRRKDGTTFSVLVNAIAIKDSNGQFVRSHASVFDISERKRAASELSESEARNTAILHAALDCIVSIDSHGKIIEFNPAAERTFGYAREAGRGQGRCRNHYPGCHARRPSSGNEALPDDWRDLTVGQARTGHRNEE